ncbi:PucR family transcriptional regulator [Embleya sp. MST-111070]|uniref:PucR family transcriptional regulator n=1 Tax=Embleya sp. MST-111070 TaxID=3398231 RepID=UPI003F737596
MRVLLLSGGSPQRALEVVGHELAERGLPVFGAVRARSAAVLLPGDSATTAEAVANSVAGGGRSRCWAGLSAVHQPADGPIALREAVNAAAVAQARGGNELVGFESLAGQVLVTALASRAVLEEISAAKLASLGDYDRAHGAELLASLRVFLEYHGQWEAASTAVGVHRHTLRSRMDRIQAVLGADLDSAHVRAELLLALAVWPGTAHAR